MNFATPQQAAAWALSKKHDPHFAQHYAEVRPIPLNLKFPKNYDCSGFFTWCYWACGLDDPNGMAYNGSGYTGTLVANGVQVPLATAALPGDAVIYFSDNTFKTSVHVAMVVSPGADPLTISMGEEGDPSAVHVSQDGRPHKFYRFSHKQHQAPQAIPA